MAGAGITHCVKASLGCAAEERYSRAVLRACPFCRTLYRADEGADCADCGVALVPMNTLGPSHEAALEDPALAVLPEDEELRWDDFRRGRGALLLLSALGLVLFFCPWVEIIVPETAVRSGFDLARGRAGWLWGGAASYFVLIPLVWTRRTISRMRGVRVVTCLLAVMTLSEVAMMLIFTPTGHGMVPLRLEWMWGFFASGLVSLAATIVAFRFGGALPPLPTDAHEQGGSHARPRLSRPDGQTLH